MYKRYTRYRDTYPDTSVTSVRELVSGIHNLKTVELNRRRTKSENVSVEITSPQEGTTRGLMVADPNTYGAAKLWCILQPIPVEVDSEFSEPPSDDVSD